MNYKREGIYKRTEKGKSKSRGKFTVNGFLERIDFMVWD